MLGLRKRFHPDLGGSEAGQLIHEFLGLPLPLFAKNVHLVLRLEIIEPGVIEVERAEQQDGGGPPMVFQELGLLYKFDHTHSL